MQPYEDPVSLSDMVKAWMWKRVYVQCNNDINRAVPSMPRHELWEGESGGLLLSSMPLWWEDWWALNRAIDTSVIRINTSLDEGIAWHWMVSDRSPDYSRSASFCDVWMQCRRMWITCRWPNLIATIHSGIRRDCACLLDVPIAGSPHRRPWSVSSGHGDGVWNLWDRGTRMSRGRSSMLVSTP
jgi:hypothetical protein